MAWNQVYLDNTPGSTWSTSNYTIPLTGSATSVMGRASFGSNVSIRGDLQVFGSTTGTSAFSGSAGTFTTVAGQTSVRLGSAGTPVTRLSYHTQTVAGPISLTATKSTETTWANNAAAVGDVIIPGGPDGASGLSAGIAFNMYVSAASTIALRLSNVSAAAASQQTQVWSYWLIRN